MLLSYIATVATIEIKGDNKLTHGKGEVCAAAAACAVVVEASLWHAGAAKTTAVMKETTRKNFMMI